jgi:hypothetical protein
MTGILRSPKLHAVSRQCLDRLPVSNFPWRQHGEVRFEHLNGLSHVHIIAGRANEFCALEIWSVGARKRAGSAQGAARMALTFTQPEMRRNSLAPNFASGARSIGSEAAKIIISPPICAA